MLIVCDGGDDIALCVLKFCCWYGSIKIRNGGSKSYDICFNVVHSNG